MTDDGSVGTPTAKVAVIIYVLEMPRPDNVLASGARTTVKPDETAEARTMHFSTRCNKSVLSIQYIDAPYARQKS
jgi:hypothetical protein